ncbi:unnamed protein product [Ectocarpus sp. CCAP 1310/34]|nr:unnamed protein product [Ectocarpus sp. CCAP 1310/34]
MLTRHSPDLTKFPRESTQRSSTHMQHSLSVARRSHAMAYCVLGRTQLQAAGDNMSTTFFWEMRTG